MAIFEELVNIQQQLWDAIEKQKINYGKDGDSRKTEDYLNQRLAELEAKWRQFVENDTNINNNYTATENPNNYWSERQKWSQAILQYRQKLIDKLEERKSKQQPITPHTSKNNEPKFTSQEGKLIQKIRGKILMLRNHIRTLEIDIRTPKTKAFYKHKMQLLNNYFGDIATWHDGILENDTDQTDIETYINNQEFQSIERDWQEIVIEIQEQLDSLDIKDEHSTQQHKDIKLPRMEIPHFYGDRNKWMVFRDIFERLVHDNNSISQIQKMNYLKTSLGGEAAKLVNHIQCTEKNYNTAWEIIKERYNNRRLLVTAQISTLIDQSSITTESASGIRSLHDTIKEVICALQTLDVDTSTWDPIIIHLMLKKLDSETLRLYETSITDPKEIQTLNEFLKFLEKRFNGLQAVADQKRVKNSYYNHQPKVKGFLVTKTSCKQCGGSHCITTCMNFRKMSFIERNQLVNLLQLCRRCFSGDHTTRQCTTPTRCIRCSGNHHELLHSSEVTNQGKNKTTSLTTQVAVKNNKTNEIGNQLSQGLTLLGTAVAVIKMGQTKNEYVRILIDPGSQGTFITQEAAKKLNLRFQKTHVELAGIGETKAGIINKVVTCILEPRFPSNFSVQIKALVINNLTKILPDHQINAWQWKHINDLVWADPNYHEPGKIDILLGADFYPMIMLSQIAKGRSGEPIAQRTEFGWIIFGPTNRETTKIQSLITLTEIDENMKKFWELEEIKDKKGMNHEEQLAEEHYKATHRRDSTGRYVVSLPFKPNSNPLGHSRHQAIARFLQLERKLIKSEKMAIDYKKCIQEYIDLGHMKPCEENQSNVVEYYIPHHAVIKNDSLTTKLRVVFDASAKTSNGTSLNDNQLVGPTLQDDLMSIIMRFRKYKFAFTADIEKMYRQIKISEEDQRYQKVVWRHSPAMPIKDYKLTTVTFGTASAPYLAIRTLKQLAQDDAGKYPLAAKILLKDFYVDDVISGGNNLEEVVKSQKELIKILEGAGFNLHKWASNHSSLLTNIPKNIQHNEKLQISPDDTIKTLGIYWNPTMDHFEFKVNALQDKTVTTKRQILSEASKLFDPLGWLSPIIIVAKLLMQELWLAGRSWDEELPTEIKEKWNKYKKSLPNIERIRIPRWIKHTNNSAGQIHGFCDASEKAYAAVVYYSVIDVYGNITTTSLIAAKTKVAPIKTKVSLPRLELCGALLLSKLLQSISHNMGLNNTPIYAWTDSMVTLSWIKGNPHKFKTFVANRVSQIQTIIQPSQWNYVSSTDNPADCASRGIKPDQLQAHPLWWHGPKWLQNAKVAIPTYSLDLSNPPEQKTNSTSVLTAEINSTILMHLLQRCSTFIKTQRVMALMLRFIRSMKGQHIPDSITITSEELQLALITIIKDVQATEYLEEIENLKRNKRISTKSKILSLNPFVDKTGVLRVGGRLQNSPTLAYEEKHPAILPQGHPAIKLIIDEAHVKTMHGGTEITLAYIRKRFWVTNGRRHVQQQIKSCITCFRFNSQVRHQLMGNLPDVRLVPARPFAKTGVDYAGPFQVRTTKGRGYKSYKGYLAIFICMVTKAVHIEVASDLTTEAFIAAYKRFTARRGLCTDVYSDNGTNFIGANHELEKERIRALKEANENIKGNLAKDGTTWHVIPPAASNFGGLWEAAVKSTKNHLKRVVGSQTLTFEELTTVVAQIEACLNSRPLRPITNDPSDLSVLTPGHFLIGDALIAPPQHQLETEKLGNLNRWKLIEKLKQDFWNRWSQEYLQQLQQRGKWRETERNLEPGQLVLIRDERLPPTKWLMARVTEVHPGSDNKVRVATVRGPGGTLFKRPVSKLSPLPRQNDTEALQTSTPELVKPKSNRQATSKKLLTNLATIGKSADSGLSPNTPASSSRAMVPLKISQKRTNQEHEDQEEQQHSKRTTRDWMRGTVNPTVIELANNLRSKQPPRNTKTCKINPWAKTILYTTTILSLMISVTTASIINITQFSVQPGIFFDEIGRANILRSEWNLIIYYDLTNYWLELNQIKNATNDLPRSCNSTFMKNQETCDIIAKQVAHLLKEVEDRNQILQSQKMTTRDRRSPFDFVGNVANELFGVLDQRAAEKYNRQIESLTENQAYMTDLVKQQLSITEATTNIIKRDRELITNHYKVVQDELTTIMFHEEFMDAALRIIVAIITFKDVQDALIDIISDVHHERINNLLFTPSQLEVQLQQIQQALPSHLDLPTRQLTQLHKLINLKTSVIDDKVIFELKIPLIDREEFQILNVIPVPTFHDESFIYIQPSTRYLLVSLQRHAYYSSTESEVQSCKLIQSRQFMCNIHQPLQKDTSRSGNCELGLLHHNKNALTKCAVTSMSPSLVWIQLYLSNSWIFVADKQYTFDSICNNTITPITIFGTGILQLPVHCILNGDTFTLYSRTTYATYLNKSFIPAFNLTRHISEKRISITTDESDIKDLENSINQLKQIEGHHQKINNHDVHHYTATYILFAMVIMVSITLAILCRTKYQRSAQTTGV